MTITLPLAPETEARLMQLAREKGLSAGELVLKALDRMIAEERGAVELPRWPLGMEEPIRRSTL